MFNCTSIWSRGRARRAMMAALLISVSGCATLPSNGPTAPQIVKDVNGPSNVMGYGIVEINPQTVQMSPLSAVNGAGQLVKLAATGQVDSIGPGDVLSIDIFEVGSTLFTGGTTSIGTPVDPGAAQIAPSARSESLGNGVVVDRDGQISVPYVGRVQAAGLTTAEIQERIRRGLRGMSQSPQVLVSVRQNVSNTIVVMGMVSRPGRQPLSLAREHLLDAIANAGGISTGFSTGTNTGTGTGPQDMVIRFTRGGRSIEQPLDSIQSGSPDDLLLLPGDRIEVIRQPRTFIVFGATNRVSQLPFESRAVSLAEALARIGGPSDSQADPTAIFVFRYSPGANALVKAQIAGTVPVAPRPDITSVDPGERPIIYRLNMMRASSYLLAQRFAMQDKDVIYIANARSNQPTKLVQIVNLLFSPFFSVRAATRP